MIRIIVWVMLQKKKLQRTIFSGPTPRWLESVPLSSPNIGSEHLVGLARERGCQRAGDGSLGDACLADPCTRLGVCSVYDRIKVFTMPEFLELRYSAGSRSILADFVVSYVLTKVAVTVYSGGLCLERSLALIGYQMVPLIGGMDMFG